MDIVVALFIGITAGVIDVIPMIRNKVDKYSCLSAFSQWIALGLVIPFVDWSIPSYLKGFILAELFAVPIIIITYPKDPKAVIPIVLFSAILGIAVGIIGDVLIG